MADSWLDSLDDEGNDILSDEVSSGCMIEGFDDIEDVGNIDDDIFGNDNEI